MLVSILHRVTGGALSVAGLGLLVWWLVALAGDAAGYQSFLAVASHPLAMIVWVGLSWAFFQHMMSGLRHLVLDTGAGFELKTNRLWANVSIAAAIACTAIFWIVILGVGR